VKCLHQRFSQHCFIMPSSANEANEAEIKELKDWLLFRAADDDDAVVDELQEEQWPALEKADDEAGIAGSEEYRKNVTTVAAKVSALKKPACKEARPGLEGAKAIHDGQRRCHYKGAVDKEGLPHGQGVLAYEQGKAVGVFRGEFEHGAWNRKGVYNQQGAHAEGTWKDGLMEGEVRIEDGAVGGWMEGYYSKGVAHGFHREFGARMGRQGKRILRFFGRSYRGHPRGPVWRGLFGGGFLFSPNGVFSGDGVAFIYPDMSTALVGSFANDGLLKEAKTCRLLGCTFVDGIATPKFSLPLSDETFALEEPSRTSIGLNPLQPEPWEGDRVRVDQSSLPQGGEGLFACQDIKREEVVSFYNGVRLRTSTLASANAPPSDYRCRLNADIDLDIPDSCVRLDSYRATLAHKANHSNAPNVEWIIVEHPRFGLIRGLLAQRDISAGEEILGKQKLMQPSL